jgi:hypothetical protein
MRPTPLAMVLVLITTDGSNPVAAVDGAKSLPSAARTKDIGDSIDRIRVRMVSQCANDVQAYLTAQQSEVLRQIAEQSKARSAANYVSIGRVYRKITKHYVAYWNRGISVRSLLCTTWCKMC